MRDCYTPVVSSSAESGNPHMWNPTTVAIFGMIGTLSAHKPITVCCTALKTALDSVVSCSVIVGTLVWVLLPNFVLIGTVPERIRQRLFAFGKIWTQSGLSRQKTAMKHFSRSRPFTTTASRSTGHRPDITGHRHDCNPTRPHRLGFPNVTGRT